jgi:hypothetical protein
VVRIGAIQAIYNAQAYCRNFDQFTGPQQMAMAQLVYQMGVNLQHFTEFLTLINGEAGQLPGPSGGCDGYNDFRLDMPQLPRGMWRKHASPTCREGPDGGPSAQNR